MMNRVSPPPDWMKSNPAPVLEYRTLSGYQLAGYSGYVDLDGIKYNAHNRRTERQLTKLRQTYGNGTDEQQLLELLINQLLDDPELDVERLANNVVQNGLRTPLILSSDEVLLDGNRRYLAHRWIQRHNKFTDQVKSRFITVPVWVLAQEYSDVRNQTRVIAEYNFLDDFKERWLDHVEAKFLWEQHNTEDIPIKQLVDLYGGQGFGTSKINELIHSWDVIMEYGNYINNDEKALEEGATNFVWFQQLQRSYRDWIRDDDEFRKAVFDNIQGEKIATTDDLKKLREVRKYSDAWAAFRRGEVERAHYIRKGHELEERQRTEPDNLMTTVNTNLERLLEEELVDQVTQQNLAYFHELAEQIPGQVSNVKLRMAYLTEKLAALTSAELPQLTDDELEALVDATNRVVSQARATRQV